MKWHVVFSERALKQLKKLDKSTASLITGWVRKNLEGCEDPRAKGKGLSANRAGEWRYRVGDHRLICDLRDERLIVLTLEIGHRKDVYR